MSEQTIQKTLTINTLGGLAIQMDGDQPVQLRSRKAQALLVYLACTGRQHPREVLADLLWDDLPQAQSMAYLRRVLMSLRQALDSYLVITRHMVALHPAAPVWLDLEAVETPLLRLQTAGGLVDGERAEEVAQAAALYQGDFLAGFFVRQARGFETWMVRERERLHRLVQGGLCELVTYALETGDYQAGMAHGTRLLELDPLMESAHRMVMQLLAYQGLRSAALEQYETCRQVLQEELQVEPAPKTQALFEQLLAGGLPPLLERGEEVARQPRAVGPSPYRGLAAFREADAPFFFGQEAFTSRLAERVDRSALMAVIIGSSGSGKSSAVYAGLLPRLREQGNWRILACRPRGDPFQSLAAALSADLEPGLSETERLIEAGKLAEALRRGELALFAVVERLLDKYPQTERLLLFIDQFEELYTLCPEPERQRKFLETLLEAVEAGTGCRVSPFVLLLTLRADFMGQALAYRPFADVLRDGALILGPMSRPELQSAIEKPAEKQGAIFEIGLVARILDDVGEKPGNLPLLEFALTLLWEQLDEGWLTHAAYEDIGCVDGALARYAEQVWAGLGDHEQARAPQVFVQLVQPGAGTEDTRRIAYREDFGQAHWPLVQHLADRRLVVTGRDATGQEIVEVVHEALIRGWGRLRAWMEADRDFRNWQEGLRAAFRAWENSGRDPGALLRGAPLSHAKEWLVSRVDEIGEAECDYIQASAAFQQQRQAERERRRRAIVGGLVFGLVVALLLSLFAFSQQRIARQLAVQSDREAEVNQSLALAAQSQLALEAGEVDLALALAMEAVRIPDPPGVAQVALSEAAYRPGTIRRFFGHRAAIRSVAVSPDGRFGLSGDEAGVIFLWDLGTGEALHRLDGHSDRVAGLSFTLDGRQALSGSYDKTLVYWDLETGKAIHRLTGLESEVNTLTLSPDGRLAASGSGRFSLSEPVIYAWATIHLWDLQSGEQIQEFPIFTGSIADLAFTPDGQQLAVGTYDGDLIFLELETGELLRLFKPEDRLGAENQLLVRADHGFALSAGSETYELTLRDLQAGEDATLVGHTGPTIALAVNPDGQRALSGGLHEVIEWDLETREPIQRFNFRAGTLAYLPDGRTALMGSEDHSLRLLALDSGAEIGRFPAGQDGIRGAVYSPDGDTVLTDDTWSVTRWNLETGDRIWDGSTYGGFTEIALSPDGTQFLTSNLGEHDVLLWDAANGQVLKRLLTRNGHSDSISSVVFHPGGQFALSASEAGTTLIYWDLEAGEPVWLTQSGSVLGVAISPDGRSALSAEADGAVKWWDLETGGLIRSLEGHANSAWSVAFVDDQSALSASEDSVMILWDLDTGTALRNYLGHASGILRVVVSPDKRLAVSASRDGALILWDIESGEPLRRYTGHNDEVRTVAWHPHGGEMISGGMDRVPIRWRIDSDLETLLEWIEQNRYVPELTCVERAAFRIEPLCENEISTTIGDAAAQ